MSPVQPPSNMGSTQVHESAQVGKQPHPANSLSPLLRMGPDCSSDHQVGESAPSPRIPLVVMPLVDLNMNATSTSSHSDKQGGHDSMEQPMHLPRRLRPPPPPPVLPPSGLNLPPPPQNETGDTPNLVPISRRDIFVERLDGEQDNLRDARDSLMGSRFRLRAKRRELREARTVASVKYGSLFNILRQHAHEHNLPDHIKEELEAVSDVRDYLGPMEANYDELEMEYDTQEWNYTRQESRFIDGLVDSHLVSTGTLHRGTENLQAANLTSFAIGNSAVLQHQRLGEELGPIDQKDPLSAKENQAHVPMQRDTGHMTRPTSSSSENQTHNPNNSKETHTLQKRRAWAEKIEEIDQWVQDHISKSPLRAIRSEIYQDMDLSDHKGWWSQVKQNWRMEYDGLPAFHTGDSTISLSIASTCPSPKSSVSQLSRGYHAPNLVEPLEPSADKTLLNYKESLNGSKPVLGFKIAHPISASVSTGHSPSQRSSSNADPATGTTSHASFFRDYYTVRSGRISQLRYRRSADSLEFCRPSGSCILSAPATPTRKVQDSEAITHSRWDQITARSGHIRSRYSTPRSL